MPPPRGEVQAGSVVCGDHPKNQMPPRPKSPSCAWPRHYRPAWKKAPGRAPQEVENQLACAELSKLPGMRVAELITYAELHAGCHMGTGPMRSWPICESERLMVWLPLSRGYVAPWRGQRSQWNFPNVHREPLLGANSCVAS